MEPTPEPEHHTPIAVPGLEDRSAHHLFHISLDDAQELESHSAAATSNFEYARSLLATVQSPAKGEQFAAFIKQFELYTQSCGSRWQSEYVFLLPRLPDLLTSRRFCEITADRSGVNILIYSSNIQFKNHHGAYSRTRSLISPPSLQRDSRTMVSEFISVR